MAAATLSLGALRSGAVRLEQPTTQVGGSRGERRVRKPFSMTCFMSNRFADANFTQGKSHRLFQPLDGSSEAMLGAGAALDAVAAAEAMGAA